MLVPLLGNHSHQDYLIWKTFEGISQKRDYLLTLSAHAREGCSSHFVCLSVCHFFILEKTPFSGLKLILGDDLSPSN